MAVVITRRLEFDAGHRIPQHKSKCRNLHGHRYVIEATISGVVNESRGQSDDGMIVDFGDLKEIMEARVVHPWDHAFLVYVHDKETLTALRAFNFVHKTVVLDVVPSIENLVIVAAGLIAEELRNQETTFDLTHVRMYETPNCFADWYRDAPTST